MEERRSGEGGKKLGLFRINVGRRDTWYGGIGFVSCFWGWESRRDASGTVIGFVSRFLVVVGQLVYANWVRFAFWLG